MITFTIVAVKFSRTVVKFVSSFQSFKAEFFRFGDFKPLLWWRIFFLLCWSMHSVAENIWCFSLPLLRFLLTFLNIWVVGRLVDLGAGDPVAENADGRLRVSCMLNFLGCWWTEMFETRWILSFCVNNKQSCWTRLSTFQVGFWTLYFCRRSCRRIVFGNFLSIVLWMRVTPWYMSNCRRRWKFSRKDRKFCLVTCGRHSSLS